MASSGANSPPNAEGLNLFLWFAAVNAAIIAVAAVIKRRTKAKALVTAPGRPLGRETTLTINNDTFEITRVLDRVREFAEERGLPTKTVFDLCLIAEEMLSYVIANGFEEDQRVPILVRLAMETESASLTVAYQGLPANPLETASIDLSQPLEDLPLDGWDIHLLRLMADRISYERDGENNILTAVKGWQASK